MQSRAKQSRTYLLMRADAAAAAAAGGAKMKTRYRPGTVVLREIWSDIIEFNDHL